MAGGLVKQQAVFLTLFFSELVIGQEIVEGPKGWVAGIPISPYPYILQEFYSTLDHQCGDLVNVGD